MKIKTIECSQCHNINPSDSEFCQKCGEKINKRGKVKKKKAGRVAVIVLAILLGLMVAGAGVASYFVYNEITDLKYENNKKDNIIRSSESRINELKKEITDKTEQASKMERALRSVVFVGADEEGNPAEHYHSWDCRQLYTGNGYYAFNPEYAEYLKIKPCPYCQ